jgi:Raf kinase inhibitor-like YbhB/YbcL family protein
MKLESDAFADGAEIPRKYTADGIDMSPPLRWADVPPQARSLALVVSDPDAPDPAAPKRTFIHWVLLDLPPQIRGLAEGVDQLPGGRIGCNDRHHQTWDGPAPPIGRHHYHFTLYALDCELGLDRPNGRDLEKAIRGHVLAEAKLVGTYQSDHPLT